MSSTTTTAADDADRTLIETLPTFAAIEVMRRLSYSTINALCVAGSLFSYRFCAATTVTDAVKEKAERDGLHQVPDLYLMLFERDFGISRRAGECKTSLVTLRPAVAASFRKHFPKANDRNVDKIREMRRLYNHLYKLSAVDILRSIEPEQGRKYEHYEINDFKMSDGVAFMSASSQNPILETSNEAISAFLPALELLIVEGDSPSLLLRFENPYPLQQTKLLWDALRRAPKLSLPFAGTPDVAIPLWINVYVSSVAPQSFMHGPFVRIAGRQQNVLNISKVYVHDADGKVEFPVHNQVLTSSIFARQNLMEPRDDGAASTTTIDSRAFSAVFEAPNVRKTFRLPRGGSMILSDNLWSADYEYLSFVYPRDAQGKWTLSTSLIVILYYRTLPDTERPTSSPIAAKGVFSARVNNYEERYKFIRFKTVRLDAPGLAFAAALVVIYYKESSGEYKFIVIHVEHDVNTGFLKERGIYRFSAQEGRPTTTLGLGGLDSLAAEIEIYSGIGALAIQMRTIACRLDFYAERFDYSTSGKSLSLPFALDRYLGNFFANAEASAVIMAPLQTLVFITFADKVIITE